MSQAVVSTRCGMLEGIVRGDHLEFRGIPYAEPPVGESRFLPPRPHAGWSGVRKAQVFGAPAPQELTPVMGVDKVSDDCLYLNVWTPAADTARRPVMVWFHGGGYLSGSGHQSLYHGARLAKTEDLVVVTCNYRLGLFGFGNFRDLLGDGFPAELNIGTRDQVAVLRWVRDNIAAFGGDPERVTIFGESAGGMSVATLLAVPSARGLFQRAIVQSGGADYVVSREDAARVTQAALEELGDTQAARVDALLRGEVGAIVRAQRRSVKQSVDRGLRGQTPQFGMSLLPVIDGDFLPQRPLDALYAGAAKDVSLLASVTRDEWNLFVHQPQFAGGRNDKAEQLDEARLAHVFERALPGRGTTALDFYRNHAGLDGDERRYNDKLVDYFCWLETDRMFRIPTQRMLAAQAQHNAQVYAAQFTWECPQFGGLLGACHAVDVPFVFGGTGMPAGQFFTGGGEAAEALSLQVMRAWANFARSGDPGPIDGLDWYAYGAQRHTMQLGPRIDHTIMPAQALLDHWQFLA